MDEKENQHFYHPEKGTLLRLETGKDSILAQEFQALLDSKK
jgi:hypothetical protein